MAENQLKVSVVSDTDRFDLEKPAEELDKLGKNAKDAGDGLDKFSTEAKDTARKVDNAFDSIARSSKSNLRGKMDADVDHSKKKMHEVKEEAHQTARESFASFSGSGSFTDAAQEIAANAGAIFGPAGLIIGGALSAGIYKISEAFGAQKEKIKQLTADMFQSIIDGQGRVDAAFIQSKVNEITGPGGMYDQLAKDAKAAKINIDDLVLAHAGDEDALARVKAQIDANVTALTAHRVMTDADKTAQDAALLPLARVARGLGDQMAASNAAKTAWQRRKEVMERPIVAKFDGNKAANDADNTRARLEAAARRPITFTATVDTRGAYAAIGRLKREAQQIASGRYVP